MITWGLIRRHRLRHRPHSFMAVRFLLGLAEAGFFPGFVLLLHLLVSRPHRARIVSGFLLALPVAVARGRRLDARCWGSTGFRAWRAGS